MTKKEPLTKDFYLKTWKTILDAYQWWGKDLMALYDGLQETNPNATKSIEELYDYFCPNRYEEAIIRHYNVPNKFYQKLGELIPETDHVYVNLVVKSLKTDKYRDLEFKEQFKQHRMDYLMAILCFAEEYAQNFLGDENIKSSKNSLSAQADNITYLVSRDESSGITKVSITIPKRLEIMYDSCKRPLGEK